MNTITCFNINTIVALADLGTIVTVAPRFPSPLASQLPRPVEISIVAETIAAEEKEKRLARLPPARFERNCENNTCSRYTQTSLC